jgi:hypothetical protein
MLTNYFIKKQKTNYPFGDRAPEVTIETTDFSTKSILVVAFLSENSRGKPLL